MGNLEHEIKEIRRKHIMKMIFKNIKACFLAMFILSFSAYLVISFFKFLFVSYKIHWSLIILYSSVFKNNMLCFLIIFIFWFILAFIACTLQDIKNIDNIIEEKIKNKK